MHKYTTQDSTSIARLAKFTEPSTIGSEEGKQVGIASDYQTPKLENRKLLQDYTQQSYKSPYEIAHIAPCNPKLLTSVCHSVSLRTIRI